MIRKTIVAVMLAASCAGIAGNSIRERRGYQYVRPNNPNRS